MTIVKSLVVQISQTKVVCGFSNQDIPALILPAQYLSRNAGQNLLFDKWEMLEHAEDEGAEIYQLYDKKGLPNDWEVMDRQWQYMYERLKIQFEDYPLCVVLASDLSTAQHKKLVERLLSYGVPMVHLLNEPVCNTLSQGRSSGIVVDIGHSGVTVDVVIDGVLFKQYHKENKIGGAFLNWQICDYYIKTSSETSAQIWRDAVEWLPMFKNSMIQVSPIELDANHEVASHYQHMVSPMNMTKNYLLDNPKRTISLTNKQLYGIGELLFKPVIPSDGASSTTGGTETKLPAERIVGVVALIRACVQSVLNGVNNMPAGGAGGLAGSNSGSGLGSKSSKSGRQGSSNHANSDSTNVPTHSYTSEQLQSILLTNILVTGSTSNLQGLEQRVLNDVSVSLNDLTTVRPKVLFKQTKLDRNLQTWQSATTLCRLPLRDALHPWETADQ